MVSGQGSLAQPRRYSRLLFHSERSHRIEATANSGDMRHYLSDWRGFIRATPKLG